MAPYVTVTGPKKGRSPPEAMDLRETRSNSQISHSIPTSIPSEFPRIDISGRALGQDEMDAAIQTTSTSKVRRVDFGGCGPPQPRRSSRDHADLGSFLLSATPSRRRERAERRSLCYTPARPVRWASAWIWFGPPCPVSVRARLGDHLLLALAQSFSGPPVGDHPVVGIPRVAQGPAAHPAAPARAGPHSQGWVVHLSGMHAVMDRRTFLAGTGAALLSTSLAAETFSGSCQAIVF